MKKGIIFVAGLLLFVASHAIGFDQPSYRPTGEQGSANWYLGVVPIYANPTTTTKVTIADNVALSIRAAAEAGTPPIAWKNGKVTPVGAFISCETDIRWMVGTTPTKTTGHVLPLYASWHFTSRGYANNVKLISTSGNATCYVTLEY